MIKTTQGITVTLSDMDGTLLDTEPLYAAVHDKILFQYNIQLDEHDMASLRGAGASVMFNLLSQKSPQFAQDYPDYIKFAKGRIKDYYNMLANAPELAEEIDPVLDKFKALRNNAELAVIVTNSSTVTVEKTMQAVGLDKSFWDDAITADYVVSRGGSIKPSGDPYRVGLEDVNDKHGTNYSPEECVVLEDSIVGVCAGLDFGGHVIHVITDPSQLLTEDEVTAMRNDSSYAKANGSKLQNAFAMSYTACKPEDFDKVYDQVVENSKNGTGLKLYNNLA